jgi:hypothetical protein
LAARAAAASRSNSRFSSSAGSSFASAAARRAKASACSGTAKRACSWRAVSAGVMFKPSGEAALFGERSKQTSNASKELDSSPRSMRTRARPAKASAS